MSDSRNAPRIERQLRATLAGAGIAVLLTCIACDGTQVTEDPSADPPPDVASPPADVADSPTERWRCRNDLELTCTEGRCEVEPADGFTPMDVGFDDSGAMSVCAYSGCWEGSGEVLRSGDFLVAIGHDLPFSTARDSDSADADVVIALDRADKVATLKAGAFAHPLLCERAEDVP